MKLEITCKKHGRVEARMIGDYNPLCSKCYAEQMKNKNVSAPAQQQNLQNTGAGSSPKAAVTKSPFT